MLYDYKNYFKGNRFLNLEKKIYILNSDHNKFIFELRNK